MLLIEDLQVKLGEKEILKHIDLQINSGETHILFGPNGSGKTSLLMTIMGYPQYRVTAGKISFKGVDITNLPMDERSKLGIGMSYQRPPTINGVKTRKMVEICGGGRKNLDIDAMAEKVNFDRFSRAGHQCRILRGGDQAIGAAPAHGPGPGPDAL